MIELPSPLLKRIAEAAVTSYPEECCGLLVGHARASGKVEVTRVEASPNLAQGDRRRRFEIDPRLRFKLMGELDGGSERIVGHYHSHPGEQARPSGHDIDMAWEPELVWLIVAVGEGKVVETAAFRLDKEGGSFSGVELDIPG